MSSVRVQVPAGDPAAYDISVHRGAFKKLNDVVSALSPSKVLVVCDSNLRRISPLLSAIPYPVYEFVPAGEAQKTAESAEALWNAMLEAKLDRASVVVSIGGGATCDAVGFAASVFMRGIRCVNVPTTLLSQVDSSIGGKTGINVASVKNAVGTFAPPAAVIIDPDFLATLPIREFRSGTAEIIKHGLIRSSKLWGRLESRPVTAPNSQELVDIVKESLEIKRSVVEEDPRETGVRKILNFGHTIGHAFEGWSHETDAPLLHGEAVAIGIMLEARLAIASGLLPPDVLPRIEQVLRAHGLPAETPPAPSRRIMELMESDKKNRGGKLLFALPTAIGACAFDVEVGRDAILKCLE